MRARLCACSSALFAAILAVACPTYAAEPLSAGALDALLARDGMAAAAAATIDDETFLRRASFDLVGRQPSVAEQQAFVADPLPDKRLRLIDRLLASPEFGHNWANYWSDCVGYRVPPPELTFLDYDLFEAWLAERLNRDTPWDETVRDMLTATGKVADNPAATFVGFHQANPVRLGAETARLFLGVQIQCAQCHDHPFAPWKREQHHQLAAFFARTKAELPWRDSAAIVVSDRGEGEYHMPDAFDASELGPPMAPAFLTGATLELGRSDAERRAFLAAAVTAADNPWFARAFVNRVWARLFGQALQEPVDALDLADAGRLPQVHAAVAEHFVATGHSVKALLRLLMTTEAYSRAPTAESAEPTYAPLRGDEVFDSLATATGLPDVAPPAVEPTDAVRFPPPPKSTRDKVVEAFGYDPSLPAAEVPRTMRQAMWLMNSAALAAQIDARPQSGTVLAQLLAAEPSDTVVATRLFQATLARAPTERELAIVRDHLAAVGDRGPAFEDLLWGLVNSAEFVTRR